MQPALRRLDRVRALAVLGLLYCVVAAGVDYLLVAYDGILHVVDQRPAYAAAAARVDEAVGRPRVERIFAIHELGVQHYVALLARRAYVGQTLPCFQVAGAHYASRGRCGRQVVLGRVVLALDAEYAVYPAVLVTRQTHVVYVRGRLAPLGQRYRVVPEAPAADAVSALGHGEERLAVDALDAHHHQVAAVEQYGPGVECGVDSDALQQQRIALLR